MSKVNCSITLWVTFFYFLALATGALYWTEARSYSGRERPTYMSGVSSGEAPVIQDGHIFSGLASYYNNVRYYIVGKDSLRPIDYPVTIGPGNGEWLVAVGRFNVLLIRNTEPEFRLNEWDGTLEHLLAMVDPAYVMVVSKTELQAVAPELAQLRYAHLFGLLSWLAMMVESALGAIHSHGVGNWGLSIVVLAILLKTMLLPVQFAVSRIQDEVSRIRSELGPKLAEIKSGYRGEEAHDRVMSVYREMGITPFYSLKPLIGLLIQVPVWIAVFNALGEMPQLAGQSFLWIDDLAYPDSVAVLPFGVPLLGSGIHLLPLVMTGIACFSAWTFRNDRWSRVERARQRRNLYWMAIVFLFLFYPFPSAMVLYWTLNNLLQVGMRMVVETATMVVRR